MKTSKQTTGKKTATKKPTQKTLYIAIAAGIVAIVVAIPFLGKPSPPSGALTTLPLGLLLESTGGDLTVVQATKDAASFGILHGDIIRSVDDTSVNSVASFRQALESKRTGDTINVVVQRGDALLTINRRYRGRLEVPSEIGTVYSPSLVKTSKEARDNKSIANADIDGHVLEETKVIEREWADFGLRFSEEDGRLVVTNVHPSSACAAYGVEPNDILFQVDTQKITSLTDFHRVAAEKFVGDTASLMLIRGENIVLLRDMVLGASHFQAAPPEGYELAIYPFASLEQDALERLLTNPFGQELPIPQAGFVPPAPPIEDGLVEDSAEQEIDDEVAQILPDFDGPHLNSLDSANTGEMDYAPTSPDTPQLVELNEPRRPFRARVRRFSDVEEVTSVADASTKFPKPNAIPRFNKYSAIRLPDGDQQSQDDTEFGNADARQLVTTEEQFHDVDSGAEFYDGVRTQVEQDVANGAASTQNQSEPPLSQNLVSQPNRPSAPAAQIDSVLASPAARQTAETIQSMPAESLFDQRPSQVAEGVYETNRFAQDVNSRPLENAQQPRFQEASQTDTYPTYLPSPEAVQSPAGQSPAGQSQACELSPTPALPVQPKSVACGVWGCDQCTWTSHNEPFSINRLLYGDCAPVVSIGGWFSAGYHTASNDLFNDRPNEINLHQGWLFAEKLATNERPFGFRADLMYGIDANDTQAFGNDIGNWDFQNGFDRGVYGWAIPQLYLEVSLGEWNIKAGHFFTTLGYEVITAPDNFFYSHAMTMYNSEPFTHTGLIASRMLGDQLEIHAGWTLGWDTGFDQFDDGSSWLGGLRYTVSDDVTLSYMSTAGDFGARGDDAYSQSLVAQLALTEQLTWIVQSDYLRVGGTGEDNVGLNQYVLFEVNEKLGVGARLEWWKGDVLTGYAPHAGVLPAAGSLSYYAVTFGANYQPRGNMILRPEVRYDWSPAANYDEAYVGIDAILKF